jgi:hypothetical protein
MHSRDETIKEHLVDKTDRRKRPLGRPWCKQDALKWILQKQGRRVKTEFAWL